MTDSAEPRRSELLVRAWVNQLLEQTTLDVLEAGVDGKIDVTLSVSAGNLRRPVIQIQT